MKCLNHPKADAANSCMFCKNLFCENCLESIGDKKLCLDCMESMAESSLATRESSFLTQKLMAAGGILLVLGVFVASASAIRLVHLVQVLFLGKGASTPITAEVVDLSINLLKMLAYFASGYGVLMSRSWAYWLSIAVSVGTFVFAIYDLMTTPGRFGVLLLTASLTVLILIAISGNWPSNENESP